MEVRKEHEEIRRQLADRTGDASFQALRVRAKAELETGDDPTAVLNLASNVIHIVLVSNPGSAGYTYCGWQFADSPHRFVEASASYFTETLAPPISRPHCLPFLPCSCAAPCSSALN